jgi:exosome complex component RRP40
LDPEVTCFSIKKKKDWVTGESQFGELKEGYSFQCSVGLCRNLLSSNCYVLSYLGEIMSFECAVGKNEPSTHFLGINGKVWIKGEDAKQTIILSNAIMNSEHMNETEIKSMVSKLLKQIK